MTNIEHKPVLAAMEKVRALSQDEREWAQAWSRDKALRDEISMRDQERSEGRTEALRDNLAKLTTAKFGLLPQAIQTEIHRASADELELWLERLLFAEKLQDVFGDNLLS